MARPCMRAFLLVLLPLTLVVAGCASGFELFWSGDARVVDAPVSTMVDAPIGLPDASIGLDGGTTGACTTHAQCGAGMCCFGGLMCVPGDPLPLPPPLDCIPS